METAILYFVVWNLALQYRCKRPWNVALLVAGLLMLLKILIGYLVHKGVI